MNFNKALWFGFALIAGAGLFTGIRTNQKALRQIREATFVSSDLADSTVMTPEQSKIRRLFWVPRVGGLNLLQSAEIFDDIFPGYSLARNDKQLWNRYFNETFDQGIYSPILARKLGQDYATISTSWAGSLDIYRRYGANVMIFGKSESLAAIPPGLLQTEIAALGFPIQGMKILNCAKGNLVPMPLITSLKDMQGLHQKSLLAIYGYSIDTPHRTLQYAQIQKDLADSYHAWKARDFISGFDFRFPHPSWNLIIGPGLNEKMEKVESFRISPQVATNPTLLEKLLTSEGASNYSLGYKEGECDFSEASHELDLVLAEMLKISEKVLLFLPPTSPLNRRDIPTCVMPNLKAMLQSKSADRVFVETMDWQDYGLTNVDHLLASDTVRNAWVFDPYHVNLAGAKKITSKLAQKFVNIQQSR